MKWLQFMLLLAFSFFIAVSITTSADAAMTMPISNHGKWYVESDCTSVYAETSATSVSEGFKASLYIGSYNSRNGMPSIRVFWYGKLELSPKSQLKYTLADNESSSDGWICQKNKCSPKDSDSAAKILKQLLANEGHLAIAVTDNDKVIEATFDTTGLNESYQDLLKHRH